MPRVHPLASLQKIVTIGFQETMKNNTKNSYFQKSTAMSRARAPPTSSESRCSVCNESIDPRHSDYCSTHTRALENLKDAYQAWTNGYGDITVSDFLKRLRSLRGTGEKAKDVA